LRKRELLKNLEDAVGRYVDPEGIGVQIETIRGIPLIRGDGVGAYVFLPNEWSIDAILNMKENDLDTAKFHRAFNREKNNKDS
jgi:hypothetical protein